MKLNTYMRFTTTMYLLKFRVLTVKKINCFSFYGTFQTLHNLYQILNTHQFYVNINYRIMFPILQVLATEGQYNNSTCTTKQ